MEEHIERLTYLLQREEAKRIDALKWLEYKITKSDYVKIEEIAKRFSDRFGIPIVAITLRGVRNVLKGTWTGLVYAEGKYYTDEVIEIDILDRFGAGDSFVSGFIYGYLKGGIEQALRIGDAMAAIKHSVPGDINWVTMEDIEIIIHNHLKLHRISESDKKIYYCLKDEGFTGVFAIFLQGTKTVLIYKEET